MIDFRNNVCTCSFFGHREIEITEELKIRLKKVIENLIVKHNVSIFLFGSNFNDLCHKIVTELKGKYMTLRRVSYTCKSETCMLESERVKWEEIYMNLYKRKANFVCVDEEVEHKTKYTAGKASYVERNYAMINNSDYCVFFYDESYKPEMRKISRRSVVSYQPNSGTALAYKYACQKKKIIINLAQSKIDT